MHIYAVFTQLSDRPSKVCCLQKSTCLENEGTSLLGYDAALLGKWCPTF